MARAIAFVSIVFFFFVSTAAAQVTFYPATGLYNGFLRQMNIVECDNNNSAAITVGFTMTRGDGVVVDQWITAIPAFGSQHIDLSTRAPIADTIGTYTIEVADGQELLGDKLNCRTSFYRTAAAGAPKQFEYAYVLPVQNPQFGQLSGVINSLNPSAGGLPTFNWLSVVNFDDTTFTGTVEVYDAAGALIGSPIPVPALGKFGRADIPLGHTQGQVLGVYKVIPDNGSVKYDAFVIRYSQNASGSYNFAFPVRASSGSCSGAPLLASTMGNGLTNNVLEVANITPLAINVTLELRDRFGQIVPNGSELRTVQPNSQTHFAMSDLLDPPRLGNVGTATVRCDDPSDQLLVQSVYYGAVPGSANVEWSYATQSVGNQNVTKNAKISLPFNTFVGMANWVKLADSSGAVTEFNYDVFNNQGIALASLSCGSAGTCLAAGGTSDIGVHQLAPPDNIGSMVTEPVTDSASFSGEVLRVLSRSDGQIGNIVRIPGIIQQGGVGGNTVNSGGQPSFLGDPQSLAQYRDTVTRSEMSHLLTATRFGASYTETTQWLNRGIERTVDDQMTFGTTGSLDVAALNWADGDEDPDLPADFRFQHYGIERAWLHRMINTPYPFKERMAMILHDLFATSCRVLNSNDMSACWDHVELVRAHALGNFRSLLSRMNTDYTMLVWLNGNLNNKFAPDENYGREHWELFSMGEKSKHTGRYELYTSDDIFEAARAFTGWTTSVGAFGPEQNFSQVRFDSGSKTLWAGTPYEVTGNFDAQDITDLTLDARPEAARFIAGRLFAAFAHDHPSPAVVNQLAQQLIADNWEIRGTVRRILLSEAFFSEDSRNGRVKDPLTFTLGFNRQTGLPIRADRLEDWLDNMGLEPTDPPDVNGWAMNKIAEGPESDYFLAWSSQYANYIPRVINLLNNDWEGTDPGDQADGFYFAQLLSDIGSPNPTSLQVVDHLAQVMDITLSDDERDAFLFFLDNRMSSGGTTNPELFDARVPSMVRRKVGGVLWMMGQHESYSTH